MQRLRLCLGIWLCLCFWAAPMAIAQEAEQNNLWVMWERTHQGSTPAEFRSHLMLNVPVQDARRFFESLTPSATAYGAANVTHETSPVCLAAQSSNPHPHSQMIDTLGIEVADKTATLRGLNGVFLDFRAVRGPRTFTNDFGAEVHAYAVSVLKNAGIPLLSKDQIDVTPGKPTLTLRYSSEVVGCRPWSLSLGLKQTTVLTRDTSLMLYGTTWTTSARQSEEDVEFSALDALQTVLGTFATDYAKANSVTGLRA